MNYRLFRSILLNFQIFEEFLAIFLLLMSTLIPLWSENIFWMISLWNLLRLALRTSIWQIFVNVPQVLGKNTFPDYAGCSTVSASVRLKVLPMLKSFIFLMIFFTVLSVTYSSVILLSIFWNYSIRCLKIQNYYTFLVDLIFYFYELSFWIFGNASWLTFTLTDIVQLHQSPFD